MARTPAKHSVSGIISPKISFPVDLHDHAKDAAHAEGFRGERQFSDFICMVVQEWIDHREARRGDKHFPKRSTDGQ